MRSKDRTRPALSLVPTVPAPRSSASALRTCWCGWQVVRGATRTAEIEWATHQVETHATEQERHRIATAVMNLEDYFAAIGEDLPPHLAVQAVHEVMFAADVSGVAA